MIVITGATGQLGRLVIEQLLQLGIPADHIVAAVRTPAKASDLASRGVIVREADYNRPDTLRAALAGARRVLLISSSEVGQRIAQHRAVIEAARAESVEQLLYTSILHADRSPLFLAQEHRQTEAMILSSGLPYALLRNGWYTENYLMSVPSALQAGALIGSAGDGLIASATREDYAAAAAVVLTRPLQDNAVLELAGDTAYTLNDLVAEVNHQTGAQLQYKNLTQAEFAAALTAAGLPAGFPAVLADSDIGAAQGGLFDDSHQLSALIGRPTTSLADALKRSLTQA
ncbi:SDR family oxidoreductase [Pseudomonas sp. BN605]|uniref:NAD(P)-dependent oxidoreductase n=1 Tax=Pseudomonas hunanensis TaxID=1247546 RepID=A0ABD6MYK9_9PSED|nr:MULTISPECIES: SDR family oxidoreductase [Pseudomonas]MDH4847929.1 SDR family oxidoreductase [Pseudomonas sp. BN605]NWL45643.1 NAD(P)-dependent oxidoreductase [Pseudomonas hunanensis]